MQWVFGIFRPMFILHWHIETILIDSRFAEIFKNNWIIQKLLRVSKNRLFPLIFQPSNVRDFPFYAECNESRPQYGMDMNSLCHLSLEKRAL